MGIKHKPLLESVDTIVVVLAFLIYAYTVVIDNVKLVAFYFIFNAIPFFIYLYFIHGLYALDTLTVFEFSLDIIASFIILVFVSSQIFKIHRIALERAKMAEEEVGAQNEELIASNEEFEVLNDELISSQEELLESESMYRSLFENTGAATIILEADYTVSMVNSETEKITGYSREEIVNKMKGNDIIISPDREFAERLHYSRLRGENVPSEYEVKFLDKQNVLHDALVKVDLIPGTKKSLASIIDISVIKRAEAELQEQKDVYRSLFENNASAVFMMDQDCKILTANSEIEKMTGYSRSEIEEGLSCTDFIIDDDIEKFDNYIQRLKQGEDVSDGIELRIYDRMNKIRYVAMKIGAADGIDKMIGSAIDFSSRKEAEFKLKQSEEKFRTMIEHSSEVISIISTDGIYSYNSPSVENICGYNPQELQGRNIFAYIHPDEKESLKEILVSSLHGGKLFPLLECKYKHGDGTWHNAEIIATNLENNPLINGVLLNIRDVTARKQAEDEASFYRSYDTLTELPKREKFVTKLEYELEKATKRNQIFAIICLGIDKFKGINDIYGPGIGDILLKRIGASLKFSFREDDIVARFGGDEFMILLSNISSNDDVLEIVNKAFGIFFEPFIIEDNIIKISVSIGVSLYPNDGVDVQQLLKSSEAAMYMAKAKGRNTYHLFDHDLHDKIINRIKLEGELAAAIASDMFVAYYQPKVSRNGELIGMESLIRWIHPEWGIVPPDEFIPLAEKTGLIREIGYDILKKSCRQNVEWQEKGYAPLRVAVNLSPYQFSQTDLIDMIKQILDETGLDPMWLELEITESGIMKDEKESIKRIAEIHDLGIKISIDDFGTGYSSLSKLKLYRVDSLKIDRSFIVDLPGDEMSENITTVIIDLGHTLGYEIVAEGVEDKSQLDFLIERGCEVIQGYYYSKPVPAEEFEDKFLCNPKNL